MITREFPPDVYGGAGVHVTELSKVLQKHLDLRIRCFGEPRETPGATAYRTPGDLASANPAIQTLGTDLEMVSDLAGADLLHSHTWYANFAGHVGGLLHGVPHVLSAHSLEPLRPWKAEQLAGGYQVSKYIEATSYAGASRVIAVSHGMRSDILRAYPDTDPKKVSVVHNGIDVDYWQPDHHTDLLQERGINPDLPTAVFVGRITRQKGLPYLLRAIDRLPDEYQFVLCASAPDTPEIAAEVNALVAGLQQKRSHIVWIQEKAEHRLLQQILTHATVFVCPSLYEPLGIVNLEAMACETAVLATQTGGIPEVVQDGVTGVLVPIEQVTDGSGTPLDPEAFVDNFAEALLNLLQSPDRARLLGQAGRKRAREHFSWDSIAQTTIDVYRKTIEEYQGTSN